jgi:putative FmdB family regulatory protein
MPIFVYRCDCGTTFERLVPRDAAAPDCPSCGGATRKIPAGPSLRRRGASGSAGGTGGAGEVPLPWRGAVAGGPAGMQREVQLRQNIVAKGSAHPGNPGSTAPPPAGTD